MLLIIDNYDSFTFNLVQYLGQLGVEQKVIRNDRISLKEIEVSKPEKILLSPGPCSPNEAGICLELVQTFAGKIPLFGVCLGHQCIGQAFGGKIVRADRLMHGKTSPIRHDEKGLFKTMPNPFEATRYHSLIIDRESCPPVLEITAETSEGEIMGIRHRELPLWGVQFHPESLATRDGIRILENFIHL